MARINVHLDSRSKDIKRRLTMMILAKESKKMSMEILYSVYVVIHKTSMVLLGVYTSLDQIEEVLGIDRKDRSYFILPVIVNNDMHFTIK